MNFVRKLQLHGAKTWKVSDEAEVLKRLLAQMPVAGVAKMFSVAPTSVRYLAAKFKLIPTVAQQSFEEKVKALGHKTPHAFFVAHKEKSFVDMAELLGVSSATVSKQFRKWVEEVSNP